MSNPPGNMSLEEIVAAIRDLAERAGQGDESAAADLAQLRQDLGITFDQALDNLEKGIESNQAPEE